MNKSISKSIISFMLTLVLLLTTAFAVPEHEALAAVKLNYTEVLLAVGQTVTLKITGTTAKSYSTSKKSVATVSSKGKVTAVKEGTATITVKGANKKSYKCKITVVKKKVAETLVLASEKTITALGNVNKEAQTSYTYDSAGMLTGKVYSDADKQITYAYTYYSGKKLKTVKATEFYKYGKNTTVEGSTSVDTYLEDGTLSLHEVYEGGKLVASEDYINNVSFTISEDVAVVNDYDEKGNLLSESYYRGEEELPYQVNTYNAAGKLEKEEEYSVSVKTSSKGDTYSSQLTSETVYTYSKKNALTSSVLTNYDGKNVTSTTEIEYDVNGDAVNFKQTDINGKKQTVSGWSEKVTFDSSNRRTKVVYSVYNTDGSLTKEGEYSYSFDKNGNETSVAYSGTDGTSYKTEWTYNSKNVNTNIKMYENGVLVEENSYNANGLITRSYIFSGNDYGTTENTIETEYNADGIAIKETETSVDTTFIYSLDAAGKPKKTTEVHETKYVTTYDPADWVVDETGVGYYQYFVSRTHYLDKVQLSNEKYEKKTTSNSVSYTYTYDGEKIITYKYEYDAQGNCVLSATVDTNGNTTGSTSHKYTYDSSKRMTSNATYYNDKLQSMVKYSFDSKGNLLSETVTDGNGKVTSDKTWEYKTLKDMLTK